MSTPQLKRYAIVGMGHRSSMYIQAIVQDFKDSATLVGICDTNQSRLDYAQQHITECGGQKVAAYKDDDFDKMVHEQKVEVVIVIVIDRFHHKYCVRAMELGCDAITEKPMTIDEEKLQAMIDAEKKTGKKVRVLFNYRYAPHHTKMRELIASGIIGEISTLHMDWILDCPHGADFMRRWHRHKETSGGIQMHKSTHHFDLVNFWLNTDPEMVYALGSLQFYGKKNAQSRGDDNHAERYYNHDASKDDPFAFKIDANERFKSLYLNAEHEDGYIRDRDPFGIDDITIEDNLSMIIKYKGSESGRGPVMTYNTYAYAPWEGYRCTFNGTKGRIEINVVESGYNPTGDPINAEVDGDSNDYIQGGVEATKIVVYPMFDKPYVVPVVKGVGSHGGGDTVMLRDLLLGDQEDKFKRAAGIRDGGNAVLVGVGANRSMASGMPVQVQELVKW